MALPSDKKNTGAGDSIPCRGSDAEIARSGWPRRTLYRSYLANESRVGMIFPARDKSGFDRIVQDVRGDALRIAVGLTLDMIVAIAQPEATDNAVPPGAARGVAFEPKEKFDQVAGLWASRRKDVQMVGH